jgi:hypothetical protein
MGSFYRSQHELHSRTLPVRMVVLEEQAATVLKSRKIDSSQIFPDTNVRVELSAQPRCSGRDHYFAKVTLNFAAYAGSHFAHLVSRST